MKQLIVNGQNLDLSDDGLIALTLQVNNIAELQDRQASYSNQIKVPMTSRNRIILGNPESASTNSQKPYRLLPTSFIQNGVMVIPSGLTEILEVDGINATLILYSGILDFFTIIKDKKLSDLNLSEFNHLYNAASAKAAINNTDGYVYPILQTGTVAKTNSNQFYINYQVPCIYMHTLIDKIFQFAGYDRVGNIFSDAFYKKIVIQCNGDLQYPQSFIDSRSCTVGTYTVLQHSQSTFGGSGDLWGPFIFPFNNESAISTYSNIITHSTYYTGYSDGTSNCFDPASYKYTANGSYELQFDVSIPIDLNMGASRATAKVTLFKNGSEIANNIFPGNAGGSGTPRYQVIKIDNKTDICQPGDQYWVTFEIRTETDLTLYDATVPSPAGGERAFTKDNIYFKVTIINAIDINMLLPVSMILPDMAMTDLIKAWAQMFGIIFQPDALTNTMECVQFKEIPKSSPVDWSAKLDLSQSILTSYRYDGYAQKNNMKYADASENEKTGLGDGYFLVDDTTLQKSADVITLPFQASDSTVVLDNITCAQVPLYVANTSSGFDRKTVKPRIFAIKTVQADILYKDNVNTGFTSTGLTNIPVAYFNDASQDHNLSFANDLNDQNYAELINALDKCKIVKAYFYLTETDIQNLDFFRQVYVRYFNSMFYVNVINQYVEGKSTLVELVRL